MCLRRGRKSGFTLIELLVVIAIIALLVSILVPTLQSAREIARRATCASQMKGQGYGIIMYAQENVDWYVPMSYKYADHDPAAPSWVWTNIIVHYFDASAKTQPIGGVYGDVGWWPDSGDQLDFTWHGYTTIHSKFFKCPSQRLSGGGDHYMLRGGWGWTGTAMNVWYKGLGSSSMIKTDSFGNPVSFGAVYEMTYAPGVADSTSGGWSACNWNGGSNNSLEWITFRMPHIQKSCNMLMLGGNVKTWGQQDLKAYDEHCNGGVKTYPFYAVKP